MGQDWLVSRRKALRQAQSEGRRLVIEGRPWLVYELPSPQFDRRHSGALVFESEDVMRRVRNFPAHWRNLSDDDLFAVSLLT